MFAGSKIYTTLFPVCKGSVYYSRNIHVAISTMKYIYVPGCPYNHSFYNAIICYNAFLPQIYKAICSVFCIFLLQPWSPFYRGLWVVSTWTTRSPNRTTWLNNAQQILPRCIKMEIRFTKPSKIRLLWPSFFECFYSNKPGPHSIDGQIWTQTA